MIHSVNIKPKYQAFLWEFSGAVSGALGTYDTGLSIPLTSVIVGCNLNVLTGIVGGAGATFDINWSGNNAFVSFGNVVAVGDYDLPVAIHATNANAKVTFTIATNTFSAGKYILLFSYLDSSNR